MAPRQVMCEALQFEHCPAAYRVRTSPQCLQGYDLDMTTGCHATLSWPDSPGTFGAGRPYTPRTP